jgi:hypothetical protein
MPLTFAHPAIVLPFGKSGKRGLSFTGLVIGSMTPDFEYFFRMKLVSVYSHTWEGLFWLDVPLGVMLVIIYEFWIKDPLITNLPTALNRRFFNFRGCREYYSLGYLVAIFISVLMGAASHIAWDGFTHPGGYFVKQIPELSQIIKFQGYRLYGYTILQHASTALGGLLILIVCLSLRKREKTRAKSIAGFWLQVILVTMVTIAIRLATGLPPQQYANVIITVIDGGLLGLVVASVISQ